MSKMHHRIGRERWQRVRNKSGGVTMEYVLLAVLIAAAVAVAVMVFSRSIASMFITASESSTLREKTSKEHLDKRRQDRDQDVEVSKEYHDAMHEAQ